MKTRLIGSICVIIVLVALYVVSASDNSGPQVVPNSGIQNESALKGLSIN